ncbi:MAG: polymerase subunit sigma-24 [Actinomycetia bacterium]|nr:polymerase subunit sigma-24 [Actinomycetes bacterium]
MTVASISGAVQADAAQLLYERYYASVYRYALSQLRSPQDAEDAAQNTFLRAFAALRKGTVPENEAAWLFKIAHNVCATSKLAWLRRRRVEAPRDLATLAVEPSMPETRRDELAGLEDALAGMPPRLREAFLLREWQGLSYVEIAERLDTSQSAVETLIFRARKRLAQQLEQPWQHVRQALGVGPMLNLFRGMLQAAPTTAKAAGAIVAVAGATVAAAPLIRSKPAAPPVPAISVPASTSAAPATAVRLTPQRAARRRSAAPVSSAPNDLPTFVPPPLVPAPAPAHVAGASASAGEAATPAVTTTTTALVPPAGTPPSTPAVTAPALPIGAPSLPVMPPPTSGSLPTLTVPDLPPPVPTVTLPVPLP